VEDGEQPALPAFLTKPVSRPAPAEENAPSPAVAAESEVPKPKRRRIVRNVESDDAGPAATDKSAAE
jgi:hypothetical protein